MGKLQFSGDAISGLPSVCQKNLSKITCFVCMRVEVTNTFWHPFIDPSILGQNWVLGNQYTGGQNNYSCVHTS